MEGSGKKTEHNLAYQTLCQLTFLFNSKSIILQTHKKTKDGSVGLGDLVGTKNGSIVIKDVMVEKGGSAQEVVRDWTYF